jgi:hypothetical protein
LGFYLLLNRHSLIGSKFNTFLYKFTRNFIKLLEKEKSIEDKFRVTVFNPNRDITYSTSIKKWEYFNTEFNRLFENYKKYNACLQIISTLKMTNPEDGKDITVCFEIFLGNNNRFLVDNLGHWSFDLSGESNDFQDSNSVFNFNDKKQRKHLFFL